MNSLRIEFQISMEKEVSETILVRFDQIIKDFECLSGSTDLGKFSPNKKKKKMVIFEKLCYSFDQIVKIF